MSIERDAVFQLLRVQPGQVPGKDFYEYQQPFAQAATAARGSSMAGLGALGDDSQVMMISGLGADIGVSQSDAGVGGGNITVYGTMQSWLQKPVTVMGITLPTWAWLLIAAGVVGAGWWFFKKKR